VFNHLAGRLGVAIADALVEPGAIELDGLRALHSHAWPGNVRELEQTVSPALIVGDDGPIRETDLWLGPTGERRSGPIHRLERHLFW